MSTYTSILKHPLTGVYELAQCIDDYYGPHEYGVKFPSDAKLLRTWPIERVEKAQIYDFWKDDVIEAFKVCAGVNPLDLDNEHIVDFLNEIEHQYKLRWEKDPKSGDGATEKSKVTKPIKI